MLTQWTKLNSLFIHAQHIKNRLIDFAIRISELAEALPNTALGKYLVSESYIYPSAVGHVFDYWRMKIKKHYL